jgi:hypothetical protein
MQRATLHVKVEPEVAKGFKNLSRNRDTSVGELKWGGLFLSNAR